MGTKLMPSRTGPPNCSVVPSSSSRGAPSAITSRAWRMTAGSAHAPPIQPCSSPEAVMIARQLSLPHHRPPPPPPLPPPNRPPLPPPPPPPPPHPPPPPP